MTGSATTEVLVEPGVFESLPELLVRHAPASFYAVVSDANVAELYGVAARDRLRAAGLACELFTFPAGETSKTPGHWEVLLEGFADAGMGRDGCVVAVGGGVTGDLAGFAAATYARGVPLVQVPTSLLAMIDASLGGKTGLDLRAGKNLAGAFHDPSLVVIDPGLLRTLPAAELRNGLAEAVKHGAIADGGYLEWLASASRRILELEPDAVDRVVRASVRIKLDVVARDPREKGERAILNFGHTVGHGLEQVTGYGIRHGEAVALGMVAECRLGEMAGVTREGTAAAVRSVLNAFSLPVSIPPGVESRGVLEAMRTDKKGRRGRIRYALLEAVGTPARGPEGTWTTPIPDVDLGRVLEELRTAPARGDEV